MGDLSADMKSRVILHTPYIEAEFRHILECVADALFFMKCLVRTI